jgi:hypothetical protein
MIQPEPMPEKLMSADPDFFITKKLGKTAQGLSFFGKEALEEYKRCFRNPATVHAMCEDYRACATVDLAMDTQDFAAGKRITCPVQLLWGATGAVGRNHKPAEVWKDYASDIRDAQALPAGITSRRRPRGTYAAMHVLQTARPRRTQFALINLAGDPTGPSSRIHLRAGPAGKRWICTRRARSKSRRSRPASVCPTSPRCLRHSPDSRPPSRCRRTRVVEPGSCAAERTAGNEYEAKLNEYLAMCCDEAAAGRSTSGPRHRGPGSASTKRQVDRPGFGTHAPVLVWYSPEMYG